MICENITVSEKGNLCFAGMDVTKLAAKYGTPLYLMDENRIRQRIRTYKNALTKALGDKAKVLYASKAASFCQMYRICKEEGIGVDVVSLGELYTAIKAGFNPAEAYFHSNNKTDEDIDFAIEKGIGYFVVDNEEELFVIDKIAGEKGKRQNILLRITPGIDPHTYEAVSTGKVDSKFGSAIETGQAEQITKTALGLKNINLCGFHTHIGSQMFDSEVFFDGAKIMLEFISHIKNSLGYTAKELDLGGGYGVRYTENDPTIDIAANIEAVGKYIRNKCNELGLEVPSIRMEPGRSIVADAGMTIYTVGTVKRIPGYKNYVSVDGGMSDNPRFALYGSEYTIYIANKMNDKGQTFNCSVVGRCCESGDIIQENVTLPSSVCRGDIAAVLTTGAYNYSMASNYNRIARPPVVMLNNGEDYVAVKRESLEDIIRNDI